MKEFVGLNLPVNEFAGVAHGHLLRVAVGITVEHAFNDCNGVGAAPLRHLPAENPHSYVLIPDKPLTQVVLLPTMAVPCGIPEIDASPRSP